MLHQVNLTLLQLQPLSKEEAALFSASASQLSNFRLSQHQPESHELPFATSYSPSVPKACLEHQSVQDGQHDEIDNEVISLVNDLNRCLYKKYDQLIDEFEVDEDIARECGKFIGSSIKDNSILCLNVLNVQRTYSAALLLRSVHAQFSLGYNLPIAIATNNVEMRKHIVDDYIAEVKEIKCLLDEAPLLEECERECLKDIDKKMMKMLEKKGELFD